MKKTNLIPSSLIFAITCALINFTSLLSPAEANSFKLSNNVLPISPLLAQSEEFDFSGDGRSGTRDGGGSRGNCPDVKIPVTALMPASNWGKTVAERPTFWFDVPYSPQQAVSGEFVLQDEANNDIYRTAFTLPQTPGLVSVSLQTSQVSLETNKWYSWSFLLYCDSQKSSSPIIVEGWVQRVPLSPNLKSQLTQAKSRADIVYARNMIWYDAINHLAELRLKNPKDAELQNAWTKLLGAKGVGLEKLSGERIIGEVKR